MAALAAPLQAHPNHKLDLIETSVAVDWVNDAFPIGNGYMGALVLGGITHDKLRLSDATQALGDLTIKTDHNPDKARTFIRRLDLQTGVVEVSYRHQVRHRREYFASYHDRVVVARYRAVRKGSIHVTLDTNGNEAQFDATKKRLTFGKVVVDIRAKGKAVNVNSKEGEVTIAQADEVTLVLASDAQEFHAAKHLDGLLSDDAIAIHQRHLPDYQGLFHSMHLTLEGGSQSGLTTSHRLETYRLKPEQDPGFEELVFQYGRYLLISASREGSPLPVHRRGIWHYPQVGKVQSDRSEAMLGEAYSGASWAQLQSCLKPSVTVTRPKPMPYAVFRDRLQTGLQPNLLGQSQDVSVNLAIIGSVVARFATLDNGLLDLPELPTAWRDGSVVGVCLGSLELAYVWQGGQLLEGYLTSLEDGEVAVRPGLAIEVMRGSNTVAGVQVESGVYRIPMKAGDTVLLRALEGK